ncbi:ABC transporter substrate-binding protein [Ectobacillus sp. JY-23]|uniref:ABC transporter substrate-binding protein n=1 Tax=Ectobacillus sp. JY-23 TaxID=2933872 RepID=UPI001FF3DEC2|nr:ABC transporter substrate-binding protein [Ectobacillus sp. JY-23]UOY91113.1 ABC transporter substrate-binding protein [Ectobacillus sp. JY-23]
MKAIDHYVALRAALLQEEEERRVQVTLSQMADVLCCTRKNVKVILQKLQTEGWLQYEPGRGRGHTSELLYTRPFSDDLHTIVAGYLEEGKVDACLRVLHQPIPPHILEPIAKQLQDYVGLKQTQELDILRIPFRRALSVLDPAHVYITMESHLLRQVFDTLVCFDENNGTIQPHLAHAWEYDNEHFIWTFYLRKGVTFHHGKVLTAEDVVYSFQRLQASKGSNAWMMEEVKEMHIIHPYCVKIVLKRDSSLFLHYVSTVGFSILPSDVRFTEEKLVGTGAFMYQKHETHVTLTAYNTYFKERALLDRIDILFVPQQSKLQFTYELPVSTEEKEEITDMSNGCRYVAFNLHKPLLQDRFLRAALYEALDASVMLEELERTEAKPASSFFPSKSIREDKSLERARRCLAQSAYKGEELRLYALSFSDSLADAIWIQKRCAMLGISLTVVPFSISEYYEDKLHEADILTMGEEFDADIHVSFMSAFQNKSSFLHRFIGGEWKEELDVQLQMFARAAQERERLRLMDEIEEYIRRTHVFLFFYHALKKKSYSPLLQEVTPRRFGWADFRRVWIKPT